MRRPVFDSACFDPDDAWRAPQPEGLEFAFRYRPAHAGEVGGDWFDVVSLSGERTALVIGDVMGSGAAAASIMGHLRAAVRAYAVMDLSPAEVLTHLNDLVAAMREQFIATCVYAVYDPDVSSLLLANAGNLPPVLTRPDGLVDLVGDHPEAPLGAAEESYSEAVVPFAEGSRLLLYTDGLVEMPGRSLDDGLAELCCHLSELDADLEVVCDKLLGLRAPGDDRDDVTLLCVRASGASTRQPPLAVPPVTESLERVRTFVRDTLAEWHLADLAEPVAAVANELAANAVRHARTPFQVRLRRRQGRVVVEVLDRSRRLPRLIPMAPHDVCHRGLHIVAAFAERWGVRPTADGKVVWAECETDVSP